MIVAEPPGLVRGHPHQVADCGDERRLRHRWAEQTEELTVGHVEVDAVERRGSRRRTAWSAAQGPTSAPDGSSARDVRPTMRTRSCAELMLNPSTGFGRRPARHRAGSCPRAGCPSRRPGYNSSTSGSARASPVDQQHIEAFASAVAPAQALAAGPPTPIARASWSGTSTPIRSTAAPGQGHAALVRLAVHHRIGGFTDGWEALWKRGPGLASSLSDVDDPDARVRPPDRGRVPAEDRAHRGWITRTDPDIRTPAGLWPSDYAGVVLTVKPG